MKLIKDRAVKAALMLRFLIVKGDAWEAEERILNRFETAIIRIMVKAMGPVVAPRVIVLTKKDVGKMIRALRRVLMDRMAQVYDFPASELRLLKEIGDLADAIRFWRILIAKNKRLDGVAITNSDVVLGPLDYNDATSTFPSRGWGMSTVILGDLAGKGKTLDISKQ